MRRNAPDHFAALPREEQLAARMFEERVLARRELANLLAVQIGHIVGIAFIDAEAEIDEGLDLSLGACG